MQVVSAIIGAIFLIASLVGFLWMIVGILPGLVLLIVGLASKDQNDRKKYFKWTKICFGGLFLLLAMVIIYFLISLVSTFFGVSLLSVPPGLPR
jgi:hypothetical protein